VVPGSKRSAFIPGGLRLPSLRQVIHSLFARTTPSPGILPPRVPVVALIVSEQDRCVLARASGEEPRDVHFVESFEEACAVAKRLTVPVILLDRDWPGTDWRVILQSLAASTHPACVISVSSVADDNLLQEVVRLRGYDVLPKPLREDTVARVLKLAVSYWASQPKPVALGRSLRK
jgi:CheY-like chemotaxis protein